MLTGDSVNHGNRTIAPMRLDIAEGATCSSERLLLSLIGTFETSAFSLEAATSPRGLSVDGSRNPEIGIGGRSR